MPTACANLDLCLGDTGAMTGNAPAATVAAIIARVQRGITFMLPSSEQDIDFHTAVFRESVAQLLS